MSDFVEILVRGAANNETRVTARRAEMIVIGRERGCDLIIEDDAIAARQARLSWEGDLMRLEPLAQTVALRLDDLPITESVLIRSEQTIAAGASSITWRFLSQEECPTIASVSAESEIADSTAETLARKLSSGRYETAGRQLGLGGMGKVDEVVDRSLGRSVAMKLMLKPESLRDQERFIREAQITGQLEHPSIVPVHELNVDRCGRIFYTMKLLRGLTLAQLLKNLEAGKDETLGRYDLSALLIIFQKLCDAVAFAHSQEPAVIHRDLKPENIMVGEYGEVQVMDWGLAKILGAPSLPAFEEKRRPEMAVFPGYDGTTPDLALTLEGEIMGTPAYMPPEQARGDIKGQDQRTDIYALGAILYAILFLKPPLELIEIQTPQNRPQRRFGEEERGPLPRATNQVLADRIQRGEVACAVRKGERLPKLRYSPWISVPESLAAIVRKAMALAPAHRYARVLDLQADVAAYQRGFATKAEDAGAWRQFLLLVRRHRAVSAATAAAVLLIAILSVAFTVAVSRERDRVRASNVELQQTLTKASFADLEAARQSFVKGEWRMGAALLGRALVFDPANQAASDYLLSALAVAGGDADMLPRFGVLHS